MNSAEVTTFGGINKLRINQSGRRHIVRFFGD